MFGTMSQLEIGEIYGDIDAELDAASNEDRMEQERLAAEEAETVAWYVENLDAMAAHFGEWMADEKGTAGEFTVTDFTSPKGDTFRTYAQGFGATKLEVSLRTGEAYELWLDTVAEAVETMQDLAA